MASNHTTTIQIANGANSQGFFSFQEPDNLVVFVHGFAGNAISTWNNFSSFILADAHFAKCDIIFYGYKTFKGQAGDHASQFYDFLSLMQTPLASKILPAAQQLPERNYEKIFLVAHSLGAVLVRQAQLLAATAKNKWVDKTVLALFAPAHHGAKVIPLAMEALPGLSKLIGLFARFRYPILNDLDSEEDGILKIIKTKTEQLQGRGKGDFTKAKLVVYAMGDKVVRNFPFLDDAVPKVVEGKSHVSVCKPIDKYLTPIDFLKTII